MSYMFWVWLAVLVVTAVIELATMEVVSIWFTFASIIPFILAATNSVGWEWQVAIFVVLSAIMIIGLRSVTKKFLLKNSNVRTNTDAYIGNRYRMLSRTDFETIGSLKINDVVWSALGEKQQTIETGEIVEVVKVEGNKLIVKKVEEQAEEKEIKNTVKKKSQNKKEDK